MKKKKKNEKKGKIKQQYQRKHAKAHIQPLIHAQTQPNGSRAVLFDFVRQVFAGIRSLFIYTQHRFCIETNQTIPNQNLPPLVQTHRTKSFHTHHKYTSLLKKVHIKSGKASVAVVVVFIVFTCAFASGSCAFHFYHIYTMLSHIHPNHEPTVKYNER